MRSVFHDERGFLGFIGDAFKLAKKGVGAVKKALGGKQPASEQATGRDARPFYDPSVSQSAGQPLDTRAIDSLKDDVRRVFDRIESDRKAAEATTALRAVEAEARAAKGKQTLAFVALGVVGVIALGAIAFAVAKN